MTGVIIGIFVGLFILIAVVVIVVGMVLTSRKRVQVQRQATWGAGGAGGYHPVQTGCTGSNYWSDRDFGTSQPGHGFHGGHSSHGGNDHHHSSPSHDHGGR